MQETQQTTEVKESTTRADGAQVERQTVNQVTRTPGVVMAQRVIWFVVGLINILLLTRFILLLLGANLDAGFVEFIYTITNPLVAPFVGIFGTPVYGQFMIDWSSILAIIVYSLIAWGIVKAMTLSRPQDEV